MEAPDPRGGHQLHQLAELGQPWDEHVQSGDFRSHPIRRRRPQHTDERAAQLLTSRCRHEEPWKVKLLGGSRNKTPFPISLLSRFCRSRESPPLDNGAFSAPCKNKTARAGPVPNALCLARDMRPTYCSGPGGAGGNEGWGNLRAKQWGVIGHGRLRDAVDHATVPCPLDPEGDKGRLRASFRCSGREKPASD